MPVCLNKTRAAILLVGPRVEVKDGQDCPSYVWMTPMASALWIHHDDNVATLLEDAVPGPISLLGELPPR